MRTPPNAHTASTHDSGTAAVPSYWRDPLATRSRRLATFSLLYVSEGIPLGFTATLLATQMRRHGLDPAAIGAFVGSLYLPWAFKWAFGPIVDTITSSRFGRRRTWIVGAQLLMTLTLLAATPIDFANSLGLFTAVIFVHNIFAATQDVAIDALAVQVLPADERGTANGFMFAGQGVGQVIGGPLMLLTISYLSLTGTFIVVSAMIGLILVFVSWRIREPPDLQPPWRIVGGQTAALSRIGREIAEFVRAAGRAFVGTRAALLGVPFALLPLGAYAMSLSLGSNLAVELGLSDDMIGTMGLAVGALNAFGCIVGGWVSDRHGRRATLAVFVALTSIPTLVLAWLMFSIGHVMPVTPGTGTPIEGKLLIEFFATASVYSFIQGLTYGGSTALFMDITTPAVAATQFTAYMALANLATTYTATWQGASAEHFGYPITLVLDVVIGMLCITLLPWMAVSRRTDDDLDEIGDTETDAAPEGAAS
ncbi:MAG TPA: MFS transporter [Pseudomonadales bacterium]|nr:MFS transporter [Pseudomonadales bacterium]